MTETILALVVVALLIHNSYLQRSFLKHFSELERKLAQIPDAKTEVDSPNQLDQNKYRDITDVSPQEAVSALKNSITE